MSDARRRTPMRADAEQNRARIVEAATAMFKEQADAPLHAIAKRAGVGQGTLYRHFPSREALLLAVYERDVRDVIDAAPVLLREHAPAQALSRWFGRLAAYGRIKHGVAEALEAATRADLSETYYPPVIAALTLLLDACKRTGDVRRDAHADDVLILVSFLWRTPPGEDWADRSRRLLGLVMEGLRPPHDHGRSG
jgi:AcrR family transcriptional regulator